MTRKRSICIDCIYRNQCGDPDRERNCTGYVNEDLDRTRYEEMYRDLKGTVYNGDTHHPASGILSDHGVAERLKVNIDQARQIVQKIVHYGISERQGGGLVV